MVALKRYFVIACLLAFLWPDTLLAVERVFDISTLSRVSENGKVEIVLTIKNIARRALYNIQPIFHFHHSMHKMPLAPLMEAGSVVRQKTFAHPSVLRVGRYPIMAVLQYRSSADEKTTLSQTHASSFYFLEPVLSVVDGKLTSRKEAGTHLLEVQLNNNSSSLKNIRVMLLLPPELAARNFTGMMGFTMRPGEQKYFEVAISKLAGKPGGDYQVHLMVEYAEALKHYASVIPGEIHFALSWRDGGKWAQQLVFLFLFCSIIWFVKKKSRGPSRQAGYPSQ